ncbi:MAG: ribosome biogenesis GTPase Der [bacterium]
MSRSNASPLDRPRRPDPSRHLPPPEGLKQLIILGRTNVGKSALFNRLIGGREAIVHEERGVTRDRLKRTAEYLGIPYAVTDQAGWEERSTNPFAAEIAVQLDQALAEADIIWFVVDRKAGITPEDSALAERLRPLLDKKPILVVVNKVDSSQHEDDILEFYELGLGDPYATSALHGRGVAEVLDASLPFLMPSDPNLLPVAIEEDEEQEGEEETEEGEEGDEQEEPEIAEIDPLAGPLTFAILGRQNVGKSSLFNRLVGSERSIVSDIAGTTRDAIDARFKVGDREFCSIDTAGLKRRTKIETDIDFYAMRRAELALTRAQVAVLVLDVELGIVDLDQKIGALIETSHRACIIVANKWDLTEDSPEHRKAFEAHVREKLHYLSFAPLIFTSALKGRGIEELVGVIETAQTSYFKRISTSDVNQLVIAIYEDTPPQSWKGKRGKIFYATQVGVSPPHVVLQVNDPKLFVAGYRRFLTHTLHRVLGFPGAPLKLTLRGKRKKDQVA